MTISEMFFYYVAIFIGNLVYSSCFRNILQKEKAPNLIKETIIASALIYISNVYIKVEIKYIIVGIIMVVYLQRLYKTNLKETIISYGLIFIILLILELVISRGLIALQIISENELKIWMSIILTLIEGFIINRQIIITKIRWLEQEIEKNANMLNMTYLLFLGFVILSFINIKNYKARETTQFIVIMMLTFGLLFGVIIQSKLKEECLKKTNNKLDKYNKKYSMFIDEYKIYKHNINNRLRGVKSYGNKKVKKLINDIIADGININNNNLDEIPEGIRELIEDKLSNNKINVMIDSQVKEDPFAKLKPRVYNRVTEAIGICLDNAIEASIKTKEPIIIINITEDEENIQIKIGNNFTNEIDLDEIGNKEYTTKKKGNGYGLYSIKRNQYIKDQISIINNIYYINLTIKKH